ncbi:LysR family transcriptional regulator [Klebsiella pneumoniae]|nr:LysR family transcriptional regulator [Klebsiella pneumoniae]PLJ18277.1 LysR family transcriptional regulator [Klebsiella pneumoniae]
MAAAPYPARGSCDLSLIYSPLLLKLPVLAGARGYRGRRRLAAPCALPAP